MKPTILVMDDDPIYSKKFCNHAIKLLGKKYAFLTFSNMKALSNYANENSIIALIVSDTFLDYVNDLKVPLIYVINEKRKNTVKEGKRTYIYKLQNAKGILDVVDADLTKINVTAKEENICSCKVVLFYSPNFIKNKLEVIKRMAKSITKNKKVLIVDIDEFDNYKGQVGLSNIIFHYKEGMLTPEKIRKEITLEKDQDYIKSLTYPDDMSLITTQDLANIVNELRVLGYDYIFVNSDTSFVKCQPIMFDAENIIIVKEKENDKLDKFKNYLRAENQVNLKKVTEFDMGKVDKAYLSAFVKGMFN